LGEPAAEERETEERDQDGGVALNPIDGIKAIISDYSEYCLITDVFLTFAEEPRLFLPRWSEIILEETRRTHCKELVPAELLNRLASVKLCEEDGLPIPQTHPLRQRRLLEPEQERLLALRSAAQRSRDVSKKGVLACLRDLAILTRVRFPSPALNQLLDLIRKRL
jgi:hypothetical protein